MNMRPLFFLLLFCISASLNAQRIDFENDRPISSNLFIKLYGSVDYNQKIESGIKHNGKLDVHRLVTLIGYQFSKKTQFVAEIEYEHVKEVFIEQAWAKHQLASNHFLKAGLIMIPMGYVNENHEPTAFYSVERPFIDNIIVPSTWREIGFGMTGLFPDQSLKYKLFLVNGLKSYDTEKGGLLTEYSPFRGGRQKGAESTISGLPNLSSQLEYFGWLNAKIGLSLYHGETASDFYDGLNKHDEFAFAQGDSTTIRMTMIGLHTQYRSGNFGFNTQWIYSYSTNTEAYNSFTDNNIGNSIYGFYIEPYYALITSKGLDHLSLFARFSNYDLNAGEEDGGLATSVSTLGLNWKPTAGLVFKTDLQYVDSVESNYLLYNLNVGFWF